MKESKMKYKTIEEFLAGVVEEDDAKKAGFLKEFQEVLDGINALENSSSKTDYANEVAGQELTNRIQDLIAAVPTETLLRWFVK